VLDVVLIAVAGVFQLAVTWYAVDISVRENRIRNGVVIGLVPSCNSFNCSGRLRFLCVPREIDPAAKPNGG